MARLRIFHYRPDSPAALGLEARCKLLAYLLASSCIMAYRLPALGLAAAILAAGYAASRLDLKSFLRQVKPLLFFLALLAVSRFSGGGAVLLSRGPLRITSGGLLQGLSEAFRLLLVLAGSNLFIAVTSPAELEAVIASLPLGRAAPRAALLFRLSLNLIPMLLDLAAGAGEALRLRRLGRRRPLKEALHFGRLLLERGAVWTRRFADALEARGYDESRSFLALRRPGPVDAVFIVILAGASLLALTLPGL